MSTKQQITKKTGDVSPGHAHAVHDPIGSQLEPVLPDPKSRFDRLPVQSTTLPLRQSALLNLQRRYGNAYVRRLLGERGNIDPVSGIEEEKEEVPARPDRLAPLEHQDDPGLVMGAPDDGYDQEADRVANQVAETTSALESPAGEAGLRHVLKHMAPEEEVSRLLGPTGIETMSISRAPTGSRAIIRGSGLRGQNASGDVPLPAAIATRIVQSKGRGKPLPDPIRRTLEAQMGYDFSQVKVNTGPAAAELCQRVGARAFTHGRDIWLGRGESIFDVRLMAHELTHVVQQRAATAIGPEHIIQRIDPQRDTVKRFDNSIWHRTGDIARYRHKMLQFQRSMSSTAVDALQRQLLGSQSPVEIHHVDNPKRLRAIYGGGGGSTPTQFPTVTEAAASPKVSASRNADWTAAQTDFAERFAWVTWDSSKNSFDVSGKATGTWQGVTPGPKPADSGSVYHAGEYHQHPPLPPAQRPHTHSFPVGPSGADTSAANADNSPGIVRDFATTARTTVKDYTYGPTRRSGTP